VAMTTTKSNSGPQQALLRQLVTGDYWWLLDSKSLVQVTVHYMPQFRPVMI